MTYSKHLLYRLRNDIPIDGLIRAFLDLPFKESEGYLRFLCPRCGDFHTATSSRTNLARCFRCAESFNPIDLVMAADRLSFKQAVDHLLRLYPHLRRSTSQPADSRGS
jgi:hypothetical protein